MDPVQLVFLLLLVVVPLIQALLGQRGKAGEQEETSLPSLPAESPAGAGGEEASAWDQWFDPTAANTTKADPTQYQEPPAEEIPPFEAISLEPVDEKREPVTIEVTAPADAVDVNRIAEHDRFQPRYLAAPPARPEPRVLADHLRTRDEIRRAVLLSEVLGPPRSLQ